MCGDSRLGEPLADPAGDAIVEKLLFPDLTEDEEFLDPILRPLTFGKRETILLGVEKARQRLQSSMRGDGYLEPARIAWRSIGELPTERDLLLGGAGLPHFPEDVHEQETKFKLLRFDGELCRNENTGGLQEIAAHEEFREVNHLGHLGFGSAQGSHESVYGASCPAIGIDLGKFARHIKTCRVTADIALERRRSGVDPVNRAEVSLKFEEACRNLFGRKTGHKCFKILFGIGVLPEGVVGFDETKPQVRAIGRYLETLLEKIGVSRRIG